MNQEIFRTFLASGVFVAGASLVTSFFVPRSSPEFVISVFSACIGLLLIGLVLLVAWRTRR